VTGDARRHVAIFANLSAKMRKTLAGRAAPVQVRAGEWLFRAGDAGDSLYVLLSGRAEVVRESPEPTVLRVLGRGDAFGELALLTGEPRSASVRARRDSELLRLDRDDFQHLLESAPEFMFTLTHTLGEQLRNSRGLAIETPPLPATVAIVPLSAGVPVDAFADRLVEEIGRWHSVVRLDSPEAEAAGTRAETGASQLDRFERSHEQVLLVTAAGAPGHPWTEFCVRQADRVLALVGDGEVLAWPVSAEALRGCDVVYCPSHAQSVDTIRWHEQLAPRTSHQLPADDDFASGARRIARRVAGRSIGVVLSGGGARGLAHIGVLEELSAAGVEIDRVAGCSMGSFVGAQFASGDDPAAIAECCRQELVNRNPWSDYTLPVVAATRGRRLRDTLDRVFGARQIQELSHAYFCVSADLISSELIVHDRGALAPAVAASMCIPGTTPPIVLDGRVLVDGGLVDNLPVETISSFGEGPIIAVDVTAQHSPPEGARRGRPRARRLRAGVRAAIVGDEAIRPGLRETMFRSIVLGSRDTTEAAKRYADLVINPETSGIGMTAFRELERARELGREAAQRALEARPQFLSAATR
jgi:NTE family protein